MAQDSSQDEWEQGGTPDQAVEGGGNRPETRRKVDGPAEDTDGTPDEDRG